MTPWTRTSILLTSPGKCGAFDGPAASCSSAVFRAPDCLAAGATPHPRVTVAAWESTVSARQVVDAWEPLGAMANLALDAPMRARILAELRDWALREWGDLDQPQSSTEHYRLE